MSIKFRLVVTENGAPASRRLRAELSTGGRLRSVLFAQEIAPGGLAEIVFDAPPGVSAFQLSILDPRTGRLLGAAAVNPSQHAETVRIDLADTSGASPAPTRRASFRIILEDAAGRAVDGFIIRVADARDPNDLVALGQTDENGHLPVGLASATERTVLAAMVIDPDTKAEIHRTEPIKISEIDRWWIISLPQDAMGARPDAPGGRPIASGQDSAAWGGDPADSFRQRLDRAAAQRDGLRQAAREAIAERKAQRQRGKDITGAVFGKAPRRRLPANVNFLPEGASVEDRQEAARNAAEVRFSRQVGERRGGFVDKSAADRLGLVNGQRLSGADLRKLFPVRPRPSFAPQGYDDILRACVDAANARRAAEAADVDADGAVLSSAVAGGDGGPADLAVSQPSAAAERIAAVLDAALGSETRRPTTSDLIDSLKVDVPSGPADADAFYDYHSIQVAWSDTWTAIVDTKLKARMLELYDTIVQIVDPEVVDADLSEITELQDMLETLTETVEAASAAIGGPISVPPEHLQGWVPQIAAVWDYLTETEQDYVSLQYRIHEFLGTVDVKAYAGKPLNQVGEFANYPIDWVPGMLVPLLVAQLAIAPDVYKDRSKNFVDLTRAQNAMKAGDAGPAYAANAAARLGRAERLIGELKTEIVEPYQFDVFADGTYNFGVLATYRQRWRPLSYQAGDLAGAIPLAPNEKRSYKVTRKISTKTSRKSERATLFRSLDETAQTNRAEAEITNAVKNGMSAGGEMSVNSDYFEMAEIESSANFESSQESASNRVKKELRERTAKATQEYRDENKVAVSAEGGAESSFTETRELTNPNNELTVTYLFYELQRRFEVNERLHDLQPVIFVAFDMPQPADITEAWLLRHDWIIRDNLLDESFRPALTYLAETFAGDEVAVEILEQQWKAQLSIVDDLRRQGGAHQRLRDSARFAVQMAALYVAQAQSNEAIAQGVIPALTGGIGQQLAGSLYGSQSEIAQGFEDNARGSLDWADQDLERIEASAREAMTALESATAAYVAAVEKRLNRRVQIDRLILHVKENILHYMQAIWTAEHPDQRYLRLYDMVIQWPAEGGGSYSETAGPDAVSRRSGARRPPFAPPANGVQGRIAFDAPQFQETRALHNVADLRKLLGFRGNLAMFALQEHNALTTFMAQEFLDSHFGLADPDRQSEEPTASEALEIAECAWKNPDLDDAGRKAVTLWLIDALKTAHKISQEIIVPTGKLFIEALPGAHPLLEDFKLKHRAFDAAQAATSVRAAQIDLIRRAMRLEAGDASDPDVDRFIQVAGDVGPGVTISDTD